MSYSEAMAKHYQDKTSKDKVDFSPDPNYQDLAGKRHRNEEDILEKLGFTYSPDVNAWGTRDNAIPVMKNQEARTLANIIQDAINDHKIYYRNI